MSKKSRSATVAAKKRAQSGEARGKRNKLLGSFAALQEADAKERARKKLEEIKASRAKAAKADAVADAKMEGILRA